MLLDERHHLAPFLGITIEDLLQVRPWLGDGKFLVQVTLQLLCTDALIQTILLYEFAAQVLYDAVGLAESDRIPVTINTSYSYQRILFSDLVGSSGKNPASISYIIFAIDDRIGPETVIVDIDDIQICRI